MKKAILALAFALLSVFGTVSVGLAQGEAGWAVACGEGQAGAHNPHCF